MKFTISRNIPNTEECHLRADNGGVNLLINDEDRHFAETAAVNVLMLMSLLSRLCV